MYCDKCGHKHREDDQCNYDIRWCAEQTYRGNTARGEPPEWCDNVAAEGSDFCRYHPHR